MADKPEVWLFAHPSMDLVAKQIMEKCNDGGPPLGAKLAEVGKRLPMQRIPSMLFNERRTVVYKQTIQWKAFKDGFPNLFIEDVKEMAGKDVVLLASFHSPAIIFEQLSVVYAIPRYLAKSFTLILPYFPTGTMERVDTEGQIATAKTLAIGLSNIPLTARGPPLIVIFDIHALQERFYFSDNVIPRLESAIPLLQRELHQFPKEEALAIAFPDDGAFKRFSNLFPDYETVICNKVRQGQEKIVTVKDGNPKDKHIVIVDDLVQTGGTLVECAKALKKNGATKISAYVTHPVFPQQSWKRFVDCEIPFENFWITDSIPHATEIAQHKPFKLLNIGDVIAEALLGYDLRM